MEITNINLTLEPANNTTSVCARADVTLDNVLTLHNVALIRNQYGGFFVGLPRRRYRDALTGEWMNDPHVTVDFPDTYHALKDSLTYAYDEAMSSGSGNVSIALEDEF